MSALILGPARIVVCLLSRVYTVNRQTLNKGLTEYERPRLTAGAFCLKGHNGRLNQIADYAMDETLLRGSRIGEKRQLL
jgi:hypothetical protein